MPTPDNNNDLAARARSDPAALRELITTNMPLVYFQVGRYLDEHPGKDELLSDDLAADGFLALVEGANWLAKNEHPHATNYLALIIKVAILRSAADVKPGYSDRTVKRRIADGTTADLPIADELTDATFDAPCPMSMVDLHDAIDRACLDDRDREIVRLRSTELSLDEVASQMGLKRTTVFKLLKKIEERFDAQPK